MGYFLEHMKGHNTEVIHGLESCRRQMKTWDWLVEQCCKILGSHFSRSAWPVHRKRPLPINSCVMAIEGCVRYDISPTPLVKIPHSDFTMWLAHPEYYAPYMRWLEPPRPNIQAQLSFDKQPAAILTHRHSNMKATYTLKRGAKFISKSTAGKAMIASIVRR